MKKETIKMRMLFATFLAAMVVQGADFNVRAFGAKGDGAAKDTAAIQRAVDAAHAAGGGRVVLDAGTYLSGTIWLKDGVDLHLAKGAVLKGSTCEADYNRNDAFPENFWSVGEEWSGGHLILAYKAKDVSITGEGVIDGSGPAFFGECEEDSWFPGYKYGLKLHPTDRSWFRPGPMVAMFLSKHIRMEGVTLKDTPCWTAHFRCCDGLDIRNVTIDADRTIANSDGFSIDCTRNVTVEGCTIKTGDDGFAIRASCKLHADAHPCENIRISNCDVCRTAPVREHPHFQLRRLELLLRRPLRHRHGYGARRRGRELPLPRIGARHRVHARLDSGEEGRVHREHPRVAVRIQGVRAASGIQRPFRRLANPRHPLRGLPVRVAPADRVPQPRVAPSRERHVPQLHAQAPRTGARAESPGMGRKALEEVYRGRSGDEPAH